MSKANHNNWYQNSIMFYWLYLLSIKKTEVKELEKHEEEMMEELENDHTKGLEE